METLKCMRIEGQPAGETPAGKVDPSPLFGTWFNTDKNTGGVMRLELRESGGRFVVQAWGADSPELFDWGEPPATAHATNLGSREGTAFSAVMAKSRHRDLRTLSRYVRSGPEAVARLTAEHDRASRGKRPRR